MAAMVIFTLSQYGAIPAVKSDTNVQSPQPILTESSNVAGRLSHNLAMSISTKTSADKIMVYKTLPPIVTNETTLTLARKFNVTGVLRDGAVVQSKDLRYGVEISKNSGRVIYLDQKRPNAITDTPEKLPSDAEATKIATKFLKDRDLYPEGAVFYGTYHENTFSKERITYGQIGVWYHRQIDGLNVDGTQLAVYVGGNGDVIGYFANWRNYEPYKEYSVIPQQDAFGQLKTKGVAVGMNNPEAAVSIDNTYLAYHTKAGAYKEYYLEPVWVFKGNVTVDGKSVMPVEQYVPALNVTPKELISS
jgi:hypothetical protein